MRLTKNIFLFTIFIAPTIHCSEQNVEIDETYEWILADAYKMLKTCEEQCPPFLNDSEKKEHTEYCSKNYLQQRQDYLVRKYTVLGTGNTFTEKWRFKTKKEEILQDNLKTIKAKNSCKKDENLYNFIQKCIKQFEQKTLSLAIDALDLASKDRPNEIRKILAGLKK